MKLNDEQLAILDHTVNRAAGGLYCGDSEDMRELVAFGLMISAGRKSFVPEEYFRITTNGRIALRAATEASPSIPECSEGLPCASKGSCEFVTKCAACEHLHAALQRAQAYADTLLQKINEMDR